MREDELTNSPLDPTFGEGPQAELGDITDLLKDASIVDLSWLSEPVTFRHSNSIEPPQEDLEHNWGDTTDSLYGAFKLVKGNPSVREQVEKKSLWDHSAEMKDNLYRWAPPSISRVASKDNKISSYQLFQRLMHRGYAGSNLEIEAKKYLPIIEWEKTATVREVLSSQQGLLGNVYVDVTAFESCFKAKEVSDKYNKLAKFVLKTAFCGGCSYNSNGKCTLVSKKIASRQDIFSDENAKQYLDYLVTVQRIDSNFLQKHATLSNQDKLQRAFLARKSVNKRVGGVKASLPVENVRNQFNEEAYVKVAAKYLSKGFDLDFLREKFATKVPHALLDSVFSKAAQILPSVPTSTARCDSPILKAASKLQRSAKCHGCTHDRSTYCGVSKVAFDETKNREQRKLTAAMGTLPMYQSNSEEIIHKTAKALELGNSYDKVLKAAGKAVGTSQARKVLDQALVRVASASPDQFNTCEEPAFKLVELVKQGSKCGTCPHNRQVGCGYLKKAFVLDKQFDSESVSDHKLYSSFYKDFSFDNLVQVDQPKNSNPVEVEGLNQFNL